ncbi:phage major capsid protein [Odoribacter splanchnicus]|uniref:phage major capsid protein n=1 Tax=Odoribacter splanchnicus TaxID=28118 RepID=UPI00189AA71A|nr:phage major capsid protein [Odoribacter splanchnicus]
MRKIHEIKKELSTEIENYRRLQGEGKAEDAKASLDKVRGLTGELEEAQTLDHAEKIAAANSFSEQERNDVNRFSFQKFIREAAEGKLEGFELEMAQEGRKEAGELGRTVKGVCIPYSVLSVKSTRAASGQNAGTPADGGHLTQTSAPTYIESLRANLVMQKLGAKFLTGLVGTLSFVKNSKVDIAWAGEAETVENEKTSFSLQEMKQKRLVITTAFTKDLLNQTSMDVEALIMNEMILAHAQGIDNAALNGAGDKAPLGILNLPGIGAVVIGDNGGEINWAKVVGLETAISSKDAILGNLAYLTNPKVIGALKTTEKAAGTAKFLMETADMLNGYNIVNTTLMPSDLKKGTGTNLSAMLFGNFSDVIVGQWGGLDIIVDPYTLKKSAQVEITMNAWHDVFVRHDESFAAIKDIKTA